MLFEAKELVEEPTVINRLLVESSSGKNCVEQEEAITMDILKKHTKAALW